MTRRPPVAPSVSDSTPFDRIACESNRSRSPRAVNASAKGLNMTSHATERRCESAPTVSPRRPASRCAIRARRSVDFPFWRPTVTTTTR